jgi:DNA-binding PadR family transcriptional regulator
MLATRSWTGYELTQQVRRSLRFVWPTSEGHLYREQKRLVELGWARVEEEPAGRRTRQRYTITVAGRQALRAWHATEPEEPHLQVEGVLRAFYADSAGAADLAASMRSTAAAAQTMLAELRSYVEEYLAPGGPMEMLEGTEPTGEFRGRAMYPDRLHAVALAVDVTTRLLETVDGYFTGAAAEVDSWPGTTDASRTASTRARLESIRRRGARRRRARAEGDR